MTRINVLPIVFAGCGVLVLTLTMLKRSVKAQTSSPGAEFSVTIVTKYFDSNKSLARTDTESYAQRTDGSFARELITKTRAPGDNTPGGMKVIQDVSLRTRVTVDLVGNSKTTYRLSPSDLKVIQRRQMCDNTEGSPETILGQRAYHVVSDIQHGETEIHEDKWVAPDLGCFPLRRSYTKRYQGKLLGSTIRQVSSVIVGTPDPNLFDIPQNLKERSPSQAMATRADM